MEKNYSQKVAVTGIGMVTPVGNNSKDTWESLKLGKRGGDKIKNFNAESFPTSIAAEIKNFDFSLPFLKPKISKFATRAHLFALSAAQEALSDSEIFPSEKNSHSWGLSVGAGMMAMDYKNLKSTCDFASDSYGNFDPEGFIDENFPINPINFCSWQHNTGLSLLTNQFGINGYSNSVHTACASGGQAIGTALKAIRRGQCDFMLAGGFDSMINPIGISGFCLLGALSQNNDNPLEASKPFDLTRNGFLLGEGAGFLVLEKWENAVNRNANIYAELAGDGNSLSCYRITDSPLNGDGPIQAINQAISDASSSIDEIDYINAHGTSTKMNDQSECAAMNSVFKSRIKDEIYVSSTKGCMGHLIAAAGAVEAAVCCLSIKNEIAPINANYKTPDPDCDVNIVTNESKPLKIRAALSNSLGFGGSNSSLVFRNPDQVSI